MKLKDYREYYIQGSDHYLIPRDAFEELIGGLKQKYINAVSYYETEKTKNVKAIEYIEKNTYKFYDTQFNEYVEETEFEKSSSPKDLLKILKGEENNEQSKQINSI